MQPLEQVTVLMTLMHRLVQILDHERGILRSMRLDVLPELQDEKTALTEAYEIELDRLRRDPDTLAALEPEVRARLHEEMRLFQKAVTTNLEALSATQAVVEKVMHNIADSLARTARGTSYGAAGRTASRAASGEVISVAFDRQA